MSSLEKFKEYADKSWREVYNSSPKYNFAAMNKDGQVNVFQEKPISDSPQAPGRWYSLKPRNFAGFFQDYMVVRWKDMIVELGVKHESA